MKLRFADRFRVASTLEYLVMGWLVLAAALPAGGLALLVAGGLC